MNAAAAPPPVALIALIRGSLSTHLIGVAVGLGIPDFLRDGPRSSEDLARAADVDAGRLRRFLRALVVYRIVRMTSGGQFALTELGDLLRSDHPGSLADLAVLSHELGAPAEAQLAHTMRTGEIAFERAFGHGFFEHFRIDPAMGERFDRNMTRLAAKASAGVVAAYDFSSIRKLVDVGGGRGHYIAAILEANPGMTGVLFDLPEVVAGAAGFLEGRGLLGRCSLVEGSFLESIPAGGDAYLLSWVLHDWDDPTCARILRRCHDAMRGQGKLLVVEGVVEERLSDAPASAEEVFQLLLDIDMMALLPGRERTLDEYGQLLSDAGFELTRRIDLGTELGGKMILEAVPAGQSS